MTEPSSRSAFRGEVRYTALGLAAELTWYLRHWPPHPPSVLICAEDVAERLRPHMAEPLEAPPEWIVALPSLIRIDIVTSPDSAPGTWRLVCHDACKVDAEAGTVRHSECSIPAEGILIT